MFSSISRIVGIFVLFSIVQLWLESVSANMVKERCLLVRGFTPESSQEELIVFLRSTASEELLQVFIHGTQAYVVLSSEEHVSSTIEEINGAVFDKSKLVVQPLPLDLEMKVAGLIQQEELKGKSDVSQQMEKVLLLLKGMSTSEQQLIAQNIIGTPGSNQSGSGLSSSAGASTTSKDHLAPTVNQSGHPFWNVPPPWVYQGMCKVSS
jgi:hypothetical protein